MIDAIEVDYLKPTAHRQARLKATMGMRGSITMTYNHAFSFDVNGQMIAELLAHKLGYSGNNLRGGDTRKGGLVFVFA